MTRSRCRNWVTHDLRRVVRSGLSQLRVPHNVAEAVLAHRPNGIVGTYDVHEYQDEKARGVGGMGAAPCVHRQPARPPRSSSCGGGGDDRGRVVHLHRCGVGAIKAVVPDGLGLDADQIERQVTVRNVGPDFGESFTGMETLREPHRERGAPVSSLRWRQRSQRARADRDPVIEDAARLRGRA